jgi:hypothetical protein
MGCIEIPQRSGPERRGVLSFGAPERVRQSVLIQNDSDPPQGPAGSVTRERIRQIEAKALRKLKHPSRSRILRSFLHD